MLLEKNVNNKILYPELSYEIVGIAYSIFNEFGYGLPEKQYQKAFAISLQNKKFNFAKEQYVPITFQEKPIGKYYLDFVVENRIIIELKVIQKFGYVHIKQVMGYLKTLNLSLAILIYFTKDGVKFRRIINQIR